jgi:hypothetical protein
MHALPHRTRHSLLLYVEYFVSPKVPHRVGVVQPGSLSKDFIATFPPVTLPGENFLRYTSLRWSQLGELALRMANQNRGQLEDYHSIRGEIAPSLVKLVYFRLTRLE